MRQKNKEITNTKKLIEIIDKCDICRLAFFDNNYPYIIPLNFGYQHNSKENKLTLYFHSADKGKKLNLIENNNNVAFEMDCSTSLIKEEKPCNYTMEFESICGNGKVEILKDESKINGLKHIMKHYSNKNYDNTNFSQKIVNSTVVFKLKVDKISGKANKKYINKTIQINND